MNPDFAQDETVYDGRVFTCHRVQLRMDDGQLVQRDLLRFHGAVIVVPVLDDGRIVLIRNERFAVAETLWELPAGMLEPGEDPADCAARELREETGYAPARLDALRPFYTVPGVGDEVMHAFVARGLQAGPQDLERYERITVAPQTDAEVRQMVHDGTLHDGKSLAALCQYWLADRADQS